MAESLIILFCIGILTSAILAKRNSITFKWPAILMVIGSLLIALPILIATLVSISDQSDPAYGSQFYGFMMILMLMVPVGIINYFIGLVAYCVKTYTASKANEQLDYLNFQLKDQLEIANHKNTAGQKN